MLRHGHACTTHATLQAAVARYGSRRGSLRLRDALPLLNGRAESAPESRVRVALVLGGIDGIVPNLEVITSGGRRYRLDIAVPQARIAIEYQGDYHRDPLQFRADLMRRAELEADGWTVILIGADHLRDPAALVALVRTHLTRTHSSRKHAQR